MFVLPVVLEEIVAVMDVQVLVEHVHQVKLVQVTEFVQRFVLPIVLAEIVVATDVGVHVGPVPLEKVVTLLVFVWHFVVMEFVIPVQKMLSRARKIVSGVVMVSVTETKLEQIAQLTVIISVEMVLVKLGKLLPTAPLTALVVETEYVKLLSEKLCLIVKRIVELVVMVFVIFRLKTLDYVLKIVDIVEMEFVMLIKERTK